MSKLRPQSWYTIKRNTFVRRCFASAPNSLTIGGLLAAEAWRDIADTAERMLRR